MRKTMKIPKGGVAFFDSGIGGLTVLHECRKLFPNEIFYYYGDNDRAPYGNLSPNLIRAYVQEAFALFEKLNVRAAVVACNTVTALCIEELRTHYKFPIIGAEPAILPAAYNGGEVFVLTTRATYESERFKKLCSKARARYPCLNLQAKPCDDLAGVIEKNLMNKGFDFSCYLPQGAPSAVVLGCTHYIYIKEIIRKFYGCRVYDGNEGIARRLRAKIPSFEKILSSNLSKDIKIWDARPPTTPKACFEGIFLSETEMLSEKQIADKKANKRSHLEMQKWGEFNEKRCKKGVFFVGSGKKINANIYKQMFAFPSKN